MKKTRRMFRTIISMILIVGMLGASCVFASNFEVCSTALQGKELNRKLSYAEDFVNRNGMQAPDRDYFESATLSVDLNEDDRDVIWGMISIEINGKTLFANVEGDYQKIETETGSGRIASLEGSFVSQDTIDKIVGNHTNSVNVNTAYDEDSMFVILTIGVAGEEEDPTIVFFGVYDDDIRKIYNVQISDLYEKVKDEANETQAKGVTALDTSVAYASTKYINTSSGSLGAVHLYRQKNAFIGAEVQIESKANSNSANAVVYANNVLYSTTLGNTQMAIPDKIYTQLKTTTNSPNSIVVSSYSPTSSMTSFDLSLLNFATSFFGVPSFPSITLSSTSVSAGNQNVNWTMYKLGGIYGMDGTTYNDVHGMPARMFAHITGGTSPVTQTASARASIRYLYVYMTGYDDAYTSNFSTSYSNWATGTYTTNPIR